MAGNAEVDLIWHGKRLYRLDLFQLVENRLYVVTENTSTHSGLLLEGEILSANLSLTKRNGFDPDKHGQINYHRYRNIYDAMRGLGVVHKRYEAMEVPDLDIWQEGLQHILIMIGDLVVDGEHDPVAEIFAAMVEEQAARHAWVEDHDKVKAYVQTVGLTFNDKAGRFNPGRLPLKVFSAKDALGRRRRKTRVIGLKMDARVAVLAAHLEQLIAKREEIETAVCRLLRNRQVFGRKADQVVTLRKAQAMEDYAKTLREIHTRPFGPWSFRHTAWDLERAATFLRLGDQQAAQVFLERIMSAMTLVALRLQWERTLTVVSRTQRLRQTLSPQAVFHLSTLTAKSIQWLGEAARRDWRNATTILAVLSELTNVYNLCNTRPLDLKRLKQHLKAACKPI